MRKKICMTGVVALFVSSPGWSAESANGIADLQCAFDDLAKRTANGARISVRHFGRNEFDRIVGTMARAQHIVVELHAAVSPMSEARCICQAVAASNEVWAFIDSTCSSRSVWTAVACACNRSLPVHIYGADLASPGKDVPTPLRRMRRLPSKPFDAPASK